MRQRTEALQSLCETMGNAAASALAEASRRNPIARRIDALSLAISLADRKKFRESGTQLRPTPKNGASIDTQKSGALKINFLNEFKDGGGRRTRTFEVIRRLIYSQLPLPLGTLPRLTASQAQPLGGGT